jgi:hypothetical protein
MDGRRWRVEGGGWRWVRVRNAERDQLGKVKEKCEGICAKEQIFADFSFTPSRCTQSFGQLGFCAVELLTLTFAVQYFSILTDDAENLKTRVYVA